MDRRGRDPLLAAQDVTDRHQVIVDDVGEVIGRVAVRLEQDQVFQVGILEDDLARRRSTTGVSPASGMRKRIEKGIPAARFASTCSGVKIAA